MKSPEMEKALEEIALQMFGRSRQGKMCVTCGNAIGEFRNEISRREYQISRMCQDCQDLVFGVDKQ